MGIFKDIRGIKKHTKDLKKSGAIKRPSMRDGLAQASSAMADMQTQQDLAANGTHARCNRSGHDRPFRHRQGHAAFRAVGALVNNWADLRPPSAR
jgi:hypothetical protein